MKFVLLVALLLVFVPDFSEGRRRDRARCRRLSRRYTRCGRSSRCRAVIRRKMRRIRRCYTPLYDPVQICIATCRSKRKSLRVSVSRRQCIRACKGKRVRVSCSRMRRKLRRCRSGRCRLRIRNTIHRNCGCLGLKRKLRRCRSTRCHRIVRRALERRCTRKAVCKRLRRKLRRKCRGSKRCRLRVIRSMDRQRCPVPKPLAPIVVMPSYVPKGKCNGKLYFLRKALVKFENRASRCGEVDEGCVTRSYRHIAFLRKRIVHVRKSCGHHLKLHKMNLKRCSSYRKWFKRQRRKRARLQRQISKCEDEDHLCVSMILKKVLAMNRRLKQVQRNCSFSPKIHETKVHCRLPTDRLKVVRARTWRNAVTCRGIKRNWKRWLSFMEEKRRRAHCRTAQCNSLDTDCLKMEFRMLHHITKRIKNARTVFSNHMMVCDRCNSLKIRFERWRRLQQRTRLELHERMCRCKMDDANCHASLVLKIRHIQRDIKRQRRKVMHIHGRCRANEKTFI